MCVCVCVCVVDLLHNKTWMTEFARRVLVMNIFNLCALWPSV